MHVSNSRPDGRWNAKVSILALNLKPPNMTEKKNLHI
jgi:hypothetical protein